MEEFKKRFGNRLRVMKLLLAVCLVAAVMRLVLANGDDEKDDVGTVIGIDLGTTYSW